MNRDLHEDRLRGEAKGLDLWSIQDGLLQSYRSIFMTTESILFAIAAFLEPAGDLLGILTWALITLLGFVTVGFWFRICEHRADAVTFCQLLIRLRENGTEASTRLLTDFKRWQQLNRSNQKAVLKDLSEYVDAQEALPRKTLIETVVKERAGNGRSGSGVHWTRFYLNRALPFVFAGLWILLVLDRLFGGS